MRARELLFLGRLAVALEAQSLKAGETEFLKGADGFVEFRDGRADAAVHDIAGASGVQVVGDLIKV